MGSDDAGGYGHARYAASLAEWGRPVHLVRAGAWALERPISGSEYADAAGCYPLMLARDWSGLAAELESGERGWVTFTAVPDPVTAPAETTLRRVFRDHVVPFKTHYLIDLPQWNRAPHSQHRTRVRLGEGVIETDIVAAHRDLLGQWEALYASLVRRHGLRGIHAFSSGSFERLFELPGLHVARALENGVVVAMSLWVVDDANAYSHLTASTKRGYELSASYPMVDSAIRYFKGLGLTTLNLGGAAGINPTADDGLASFKRGWATTERTAFLCGRILDAGAYHALAAGHPSSFFPNYRAGEGS